MIDRKQWVERHNPVLHQIDPESPLTVGNGHFAFTADVSGLQTLYKEYANETPLCTMAEWGWHTFPANTRAGVYTLQDCKMDSYSFCGREVRYAKTRFTENGHVYDWLRINPHKFNLARVGLRMDEGEVSSDMLSEIRQELNLFTGILESRYLLNGESCRVFTACLPEEDALAFHIESKLLLSGLSVNLEFPYASEEISGSSWEKGECHTTVLRGNCIFRTLDRTEYTVTISTPNAKIEHTKNHLIKISCSEATMDLVLSFAEQPKHMEIQVDDVLKESSTWWNKFWNKGGIIDFSKAADPRAPELERRIVLSLYLLAVNSSGFLPPAETGLICNSWYGKAHLEMHFWHMAWAPLWGHSDLLMRCLPWYHEQLLLARENAARNGYAGARWPKMIGKTAVDSPSPIAVLLVWQQPHIVVMLELIRRAIANDTEDAEKLMLEHWILVKETADFMADYPVRDCNDHMYHIEPPVIPVQECHEAEFTRDPSFEVAYWKFGLEIAMQWAEQLNETIPVKWIEVHDHMVLPPEKDSLYLAHANEPDTFTKTAVDHPSMLQNLGMLPGMDINIEKMRKTLAQVMEHWNENSLWGWDFAVMAMTAARLGDAQAAVNLLLRKSNKNAYVASGNNRQITRKDLPLYLPGNGSLLLAAAMMVGGWENGKQSPGFSADGGWKIECEGIQRYF